jgi:hypothetical protein
MKELEKAQILSIAAKFAKAETEELRQKLLENNFSELEKAKLLSVASKFAKQEANEIKREILEQIKTLAESNGVLELKEIRLRGPTGKQGLRGEVGPQGLTGIKGERGDLGEQGPAGPIGLQGLKGDKGDKGDTGPQGLRGPVGPMADIAPLRKEVEQFIEGAEKRISRIAFSAAMGLGRNSGSGEVNLKKLDDVDYSSLTSASNGQALVYNSSTGKWQAGTVSGSGNSAPVVVTKSILGDLNETDLVVVNVSGASSNTISVLTNALNNALAQISALEARITALES